MLQRCQSFQVRKTAEAQKETGIFNDNPYGIRKIHLLSDLLSPYEDCAALRS
jgi:hypothetical protein